MKLAAILPAKPCARTNVLQHALALDTNSLDNSEGAQFQSNDKELTSWVHPVAGSLVKCDP